MKERKVLSVQTGTPTTIQAGGLLVTTSIFKHPVDGSVTVEKLGIVGDIQSDLNVHGGENKAVYAYPSEHYDWWSEHYPQFEYHPGAFGENLTISGLTEAEVRVGDTLKIGTVIFQVTQPRSPCFKLGIKFGDSRMTAYFHESRKSGFYLAVLEEGTLQASDPINQVAKGEGKTIAELVEERGTRT